MTVQRPDIWQQETGPFDIIGDVHGCAKELEKLLEKLGYELTSRGPRGRRTTHIRHSGNRKVILVGDLVDRGPASMDVLRTAMHGETDGTIRCVIGNHDDKFLRWLKGREVRITRSLQTTIDEADKEKPKFLDDVRHYLEHLPSHLILDKGRLIVAHAGLPQKYHGIESRSSRVFAMYGETTGQTDDLGFPIRRDWARNYRGDATVVHGHVAEKKVRHVNNVWCLDTGCVYGHKLTALRWPEKEIVQIKAKRDWFPHPRFS
ncbi:metallophosphoesterase [Hyphobacterium sp. CCMP332]|uniref:metallophosphoesterase n=1 Tax=Hyphobacterium sp. CCMP332 TaxID=2749086 RepID=UPI00164F974F|nr:metallophosphoesterase [Hyphobacterium sp. CCMP332]QNL19560.1 metallophosphoesterase [Hyphobacterium sp. CCMP332]